VISIDIKVIDQELLVKLDKLPERLHEAIRVKLVEGVAELRLKVIENLTGKVLNSKSGRLVESLVSGVEELGSTLIGFVAIESADAKVKAYAEAHEYGGKGSYEIVPIQKKILRFIGKSGDIIFAPYVYHPPAAERSYLRSALWEMAPEIEEQINAAIQAEL